MPAKPVDFELKARIIAALARIVRPATASEVGSDTLVVKYRRSGVRDVLAELVELGFVLDEERTEPWKHGSPVKVARRYYRLSPLAEVPCKPSRGRLR